MVAYNIYSFFLTLATAGFPVALSRMISEADTLDRPAQVQRIFRTASVTLAAIGGFFPKAEDWSEKLWLDFIDRYNAIGAKFADSGIKIGYHNHSHEFAKAGVRRPMDMLISRLDPTTTWIEIDTYWVAHGGSDPAEYIRRVAGRIPCVHFKDMMINAQRQQMMTEIGDGNLNWPAIVEACRYAGVKWYIVERDSGLLDPFDSLQRSIINMRETMGL